MLYPLRPEDLRNSAQESRFKALCGSQAVFFPLKQLLALLGLLRWWLCFFSSSKSLWFRRILCSGTVSMNDWERNRRESLFSRAYLAFRSVSSSSDLDSSPGSGIFESSVIF